ncbi:TIGR04255 family protein [Streptomyces sp. DI166]|uniref:TIGR04255 family protein n=1 Tax=Streptomyces sp. DI166 TaxID=1839783 RepID=UPI0007F51E3B|nr:TIGR04255 family protein [Streptomyces sp. DI166]SBT91422.1 TIGR04255 family protein [Streptomyces sp. DI166]
MTSLPDFSEPPVVEVACGVKFRKVPELSGIRLAPLYDMWKSELPQIEEQPTLPSVESGPAGSSPKIRVDFPSLRETRYWFHGENGNDLVQLQPDRLIVNWRSCGVGDTYPRFAYVLNHFSRRVADVSRFVEESFRSKLEILHVELSYINTLRAGESGQWDLEDIFHTWPDFATHHLGRPANSQIVFDFPIESTRTGRDFFLRVSIEPGVVGDETPGAFLTMTTQGKPSSTSVDGALDALKEAHDHLVRSFAEITTQTAHERWGKRS